MAVIYIKEQGSIVRKIDERLLVEKGRNVLAEIPVHSLTDISVMGNVQVTTQALHLLMREGIDVSFFTYTGKYLGHVAADSSKNIFLRFEQYNLYQDIEARLEVARVIVRNKINNQLAVIRNFRWEGEYRPTNEIDKIMQMRDGLDTKTTSNELMGVEGSCSQIYFSVFSHFFKGEISFDKRTRRPPRDPINVILSLGYTLLTKEVASALESESFETYLGFLHGIRYGRQSLALDIVEEFRQPVIDRLTVRLFNKNMISKLDFEWEDDKIILTEGGFQKYCRAYEKWMKDPSGKMDSRSFRSIIKAQISELKRAVREHHAYVPYEWRSEDVSSDV